MNEMKKTMITCALSLLLCVAALVGTSFAWFSDSVSNTGNEITAGTAVIELNDGDTKAIFSSDNILWEPGMSQVATVKVENKGPTALKFSLGAEITQDEKSVAQNFAVSWIPNGMLTEQPLETLEELQTTPVSPADWSLNANASMSFRLVIRMTEGTGNDAQGASIQFNLTVTATQDTGTVTETKQK